LVGEGKGIDEFGHDAEEEEEESKQGIRCFDKGDKSSDKTTFI